MRILRSYDYRVFLKRMPKNFVRLILKFLVLLIYLLKACILKRAGNITVHLYICFHLFSLILILYMNSNSILYLKLSLLHAQMT